MTTWIYKNGILIADSLVTQDGVQIGHFKKVHKTKDGWLAAGAGSISDVNKFFQWTEKRDADEAVKLENLDGILISPAGETFCVETDLSPYQLKNKFMVGGSGAKLAMGALASGASVMDAMDIAMKFDRFTGGEVHVESLSEKIIRKLEDEAR